MALVSSAGDGSFGQRVVVHFNYGGQYLKKGDEIVWSGREDVHYAILMSRVDDVLTYEVLVEMIRTKMGESEGSNEMKLSYFPADVEPKRPVYISNTMDFLIYLEPIGGKRNGVLHVETKTKTFNQVDRRVGKRPMSQREFSKVESGTCNVCSAPCSSCMHRNVGSAGIKLDESSDENCHGLVGSQCSVNEDNLLPASMANTHNNLNNTASEASNLVNLSHDALHEDAESKETIRCVGISDDVAITSKSSLSGSTTNHKVSPTDNVLDQSSNCVKGQEDGILFDDQAKKLNSGHLNNKMGYKDSADGSALVSDSILDGARKDEVKSQSLHNPSSNHEDRVSSEGGNFKEKSKPASNKERGESSVEGSTSSNEKRKDGKSTKSSSFSKSDGPISAAVSESESDGSEMVEHDVKVCDICGDAGREDLLAICSRCSDGAEHIYCMAERLAEVPGGDWLCEECAEEAEKQKQEAKRERETEVTFNTHSSGKRHAEKTEAAPDAKRQAVDASTGSPKKSIHPRIDALSRETSFKGLDRLRGKLNHQTSFNDDTESARSTGSQLQSPKGAFLKSSSFNCSNSKRKVQLMDDAIHPRLKTGKEYSAHDLKERGFKNVGTSMSSRTTDAGSYSGNGSHDKMLGPKVYHLQEGKSSKQVKDRSTEANVSASFIDQKLKSCGNSSVPYANNNRDRKGLQADGKRGSLTKQVSNLNQNRQEIQDVSGDISTNEKCSASEQSSTQANCKDELPSTSSMGKGMSSCGTVALHDGLLRSRESREVGKKSKRQRSSLLSGAKGLPSSQKESQTAESSDTSGVSDSDLSATKNVKEDINKGNRLRAAVDAALRKKPSFCKNRGMEQSDASLVPNVGFSADKTLQNQLPSKMPQNYVSQERLQGGRPTLWSASVPCKQSIIINEKQPVPSGAGTIPTRSIELEAIKPVMRNLPLVPSPVMLRCSAIPDHESIWQGDLEVQKIRNQSATCSGMQAHLSTLASPRVAEVVNKFPEKFSFNEVPRLSTWPGQFQKSGTKEDHIALFFFAKDIESYERNYKPLVDNMIKNDLALKGNLNNVELLIFASNQLPSNCQRWNMLYFLWGVFRRREEICINPQKQSSLPTSNVLPPVRDPDELCQTSSPSKHLEKMSSLRESSSIRIETQSKTNAISLENPSNRESSIERPPSRKGEIAPKVEEAGFSDVPHEATGSNSGDTQVRKVQQIGEQEQEIDGRKNLSLTVMDSGIKSHDQDNPLEKDLNCSEASHRKRPLWELTKPANKKVELNNDRLCEGSPNKKLKTENESSSSFSQDASGNDSEIMKKKSPKVVFPLDLNEDITELFPSLEESSKTGEQSSNSMNKEKEKEDDEASLSLSLSYPGMKRERM